jgi:hypothetical protein
MMGKAHIDLWEEPLIFLHLEGKARWDGKGLHVFMGWTINTLYTYRERPGGMGRTINILYTYRERPGDNGKGSLTLLPPIGTDQGEMGKTR